LCDTEEEGFLLSVIGFINDLISGKKTESWQHIEKINCCDVLTPGIVSESSTKDYHYFITEINCPKCKKYVVEALKRNLKQKTVENIRFEDRKARDFITSKELTLFEQKNTDPIEEKNDKCFKIIVSQGTSRMAHNTM